MQLRPTGRNRASVVQGKTSTSRWEMQVQGLPGALPRGPSSYRGRAPFVQVQAAPHLARQGVQVTGQPVRAAAWQQVPSTYLLCAQDRGTPARLQREFARRAGSVVELDAGHHPFLSRPAAVRDLLLSL
ncbi:alpha/beta fold hydrolase [Streptomyces tubercidicus]|uniref:alpha/beta fold hydrolase n=1 Tax=Streptomyces tubercidicus TaxID=47759 RepID=UPI0036782596